MSSDREHTKEMTMQMTTYSQIGMDFLTDACAGVSKTDNGKISFVYDGRTLVTNAGNVDALGRMVQQSCPNEFLLSWLLERSIESNAKELLANMREVRQQMFTKPSLTVNGEERPFVCIEGVEGAIFFEHKLGDDKRTHPWGLIPASPEDAKTIQQACRKEEAIIDQLSDSIMNLEMRMLQAR